jgi:hypothetical protein
MMHIKNKVTTFEFSGVSFPWKRVPLNLKSVIGTWIFVVMESISLVSAVAGRVSVLDSLYCLDRDGVSWAENKWQWERGRVLKTGITYCK